MVPWGSRVLGSFEGCNPNLCQFPVFLCKIFFPKINQIVTFWSGDLKWISKKPVLAVSFRKNFLKRSSITD